MIPLKSDAVFVGDICSSRIEMVKSLFVAGLTDAVPCMTSDTALISDKELEKIESGQTIPALDYIQRFSQVFNVELNFSIVKGKERYEWKEVLQN